MYCILGKNSGMNQTSERSHIYRNATEQENTTPAGVERDGLNVVSIHLCPFQGQAW